MDFTDEQLATHFEMFNWAVDKGVFLRIALRPHTKEVILEAKLENIYSQMPLNTSTEKNTMNATLAWLIYCVKSGIEHRDSEK